MPAQNVQAITEKRLKPIYEFLDNGNYKKALTEAEKVIKKQKGLIAAMVLKVIALQRLGRCDEAWKLAGEVAKAKPADDNSVQGMSIYYKEINRTDLITPLLERAVEIDGDNQELLSHLFMSHVRQDNFQEMKATSQKLYKKFKSGPYLFWNIMSSVLQARYAENAELANKMHLPLAEKMVEKYMKEGKMEVAAELRLYLLVLNMMGKYEKALEVLDTDLAKRLLQPEIKGYTPERLRLNQLIGNHKLVNVEAQKLLQQDCDSWNYVLLYLDSFENLLGHEQQDVQDGESTKAHSSMKEAVNMMNGLVEKEKKNSVKRRAPFLMQLDFAKRLHHAGKLQQGYEAGLKNVSELMLSYTEHFLHKPCCYTDLRTYAHLLLLGPQQQDNLHKFIEGAKEQSEKWRRLVDKTTCDVHVLLFERILGVHAKLSREEKLKFADSCVRKYNSTIDDVPASSTERSCADYYVMLAAMTLVDMYEASCDDEVARGGHEVLWRCALLLEKCVRKSPANHEAKFLLVRVYGKLGMYLPCADLYDTMEVKYVQHETLGYLLSRYVTALGHDNACLQVCALARSYYQNHKKEHMDCLISCYRNGSFSQIIDMLEYRTTMANSYQNRHTKLEGAFVELVYRWQANHKLEPRYKLEPQDLRPIVEWTELRDNRDFNVIKDYNPLVEGGRRRNQAAIERSFARDKEWLAFRQLLLRAIYNVGWSDEQLKLLTSSSSASNSQQQQKSNHNGSNGAQACATDNSSKGEMDSQVAEVEAVMRDMSREWSDVSEEKYTFDGPLMTRIPSCARAGYKPNIVNMLKYCKHVMTSLGCEDADISKKLEDASQPLISTLRDYLRGIEKSMTISEDEVVPDSYFVVPADDTDGADGDKKIYSEMNTPVPGKFLKINFTVVEKMALMGEMYSVVVVMIASLKNIVKHMKADMQRTRRKKKQISATLKDVVDSYGKLCEAMCSIGEEMMSNLTTYRHQMDLIEFESTTHLMNSELKLNEEDKKEEEGDKCTREQVWKSDLDVYWARIANSASVSYSASFKQQIEILQLRLANLAVCKQ